MDTAIKLRCQNPDCPIGETGVCIDGHTPVQSCPRFGLAPDDLDDEGEDHDSVQGQRTSSETDEVSANSVKLPAGDVLRPEEVEVFQLWRAPIYVAIVGDNESGKTTLIGALYDRYMRGPFSGYHFAGSRTLMGFEKCWYLSRVDCDIGKAKTEHTSRQIGLHYFHLALVRGEGDTLRHLLISDRAGEVYRDARDKPDVVPSLTELNIAHRVVLLVDGARIATLSEQADTLQGARQSLRVFLDHGGLDCRSNVNVVVTKSDLIANSATKPLIESRLESFRQGLKRDFSARLGSLTFMQIAARPEGDQLSVAHGLDILVADWAQSRPFDVPEKVPTVQLEREFDRLLERTAIESRQ